MGVTGKKYIPNPSLKDFPRKKKIVKINFAYGK